MSSQRDLTGTTIRCYRIAGRIGAGGMGEVYLARDEKLGRDVALKFLPPHLAADRDLLDRFRREAQAASALNHPNVLIVHGLDQEDGRPFIITEYVEGHTLRDRLKSGAVPVGELLDVAVQVAGALAAAHERGILHRDIKPENVMVRTDGYVKLLDFGLATVPASGELGTQTRTGLVIGTPAYMSPEQARAAPLDFRSDQFSFGIVLYELATGRNPFLRASVVDTAAAVVNDEPEALDRLCPQAPPPLRWTIERCLAKKPADRYASTRDLQRDLSLVRERLAEARPAALALGGSNLPSAGSPLLGRDADVAAVLQLLTRDGVRWVTLTGPGGVGKTRLAIQAASAAAPGFAGSASFIPYFIPLASVQDFSLVPSVIAETLEIRPRTDEPPLTAIKRHLRASKPSLLLVIDNFEHVSDGAPLVTEILECSPGVKVLAT
ncbi:MAG TPA: protein kinase, partial [Vicinamibacterales bacterium]